MSSTTKDKSPPPSSKKVEEVKGGKKTDAEPAPVAGKATEPEEEEDQGDVIDMETFQQIMDMDEEDDDAEEGEEKHSFSKGIVWGYFEQAENTFGDMEDAVARGDLQKLSSLGHFLKGSSAALGIIRVQASCEKMQHYGNCRDEETGTDLESGEALDRIKDLLTACKKDYEVAKNWMIKLYEEDA
ncbi:hypothetical protein IAR55_001178 [Kwoniella newhampshirensis]|uniref:HPt domain-containing protein n=1 Tax=Kwoniella newhampshirensis TaxID=1651941 RepID=A0AAW0Z4Z7_9TREE